MKPGIFFVITALFVGMLSFSQEDISTKPATYKRHYITFRKDVFNRSVYGQIPYYSPILAGTTLFDESKNNIQIQYSYRLRRWYFGLKYNYIHSTFNNYKPDDNLLNHNEAVQGKKEEHEIGPVVGFDILSKKYFILRSSLYYSYGWRNASGYIFYDRAVSTYKVEYGHGKINYATIGLIVDALVPIQNILEAGFSYSGDLSGYQRIYATVNFKF